MDDNIGMEVLGQKLKSSEVSIAEMSEKIAHSWPYLNISLDLS